MSDLMTQVLPMPDGDIFERRLGKGWCKAFNEIREAKGQWDERKVARFLLEALAHGTGKGLASPCLPSILAALTTACQEKHQPSLSLGGITSPSSLSGLKETLHRVISADGGFTTGSRLAKQAALKVFAQNGALLDTAGIKRAFAQSLFREILHHQFLDRVEDGFAASMNLSHGAVVQLKEQIYVQNVDKLEPFLMGLIEKPGRRIASAKPAKHPSANSLEYLHSALELGHAAGH